MSERHAARRRRGLRLYRTQFAHILSTACSFSAGCTRPLSQLSSRPWPPWPYMLGLKRQTDTKAEKCKRNNSCRFAGRSRPRLARRIVAAGLADRRSDLIMLKPSSSADAKPITLHLVFLRLRTSHRLTMLRHIRFAAPGCRVVSSFESSMSRFAGPWFM